VTERTDQMDRVENHRLERGARARHVVIARRNPGAVPGRGLGTMDSSDRRGPIRGEHLGRRCRLGDDADGRFSSERNSASTPLGVRDDAERRR